MNGKAIKDYCREQGISQNELATRVGVSPATISQIINGNREMRVKTLKSLCAVTGKDPKELW